MKKIFKILPVILTGLVAAPIAINATSCYSNMSLDFKYLDYTNFDKTKVVDWNSLNAPKASLKSILYGDKNFHDGNYALMIGSVYATQTGSIPLQLLLSGTETSSNFDLSNKNLNSSILDGIHSQTQSKTEFKAYKDGIAFISFLDLCVPGEDKTVLSPFAKWTDADEKKDSSHKEGHFKRTDSGAKNYRELINQIKLLFANFGDNNPLPKEDADTSEAYFIFWKNGVPQASLSVTSDVGMQNSIMSKMTDIYKPSSDDK